MRPRMKESKMFTTVPDMAHNGAQMQPDAIAFQDDGTGRTWTFEQVNAAADAIATALTELGVAEGDRIGILSLNRVEYLITAFACQKTGIIMCNLNWRQPKAEIIACYGPLNARVILHDAAHHDLAQELATELGQKPFGIDTDVASWIAKGGTAHSDAVPAERPWYVLFTSGTTGRSKACIQNARMCWANAVNATQANGLTATDRSVGFLPMFHTVGMNLYTLPLFLLGGRSTILPEFDPDRLLDLFRAGEVTRLFAVPQIYQVLSLHADVDRVDWRQIGLGCGGAPIQKVIMEQFIEKGASILNAFGLSESAPMATCMDAANALSKIGSVGRPKPTAELRIDGVPDGAVGQGEMQLRGPLITPGYLDDAKKTADAFTADGWFKTGDVAHRDADGYLYIVDRIKDMYISGGENVYPAEVEKILNGHPAILESAVIGVPDDKWGEAGKGFLLLRPDQSIDPGSLNAWCRDFIAAYKIPATFELVDDFPRTASGKIRKPELRNVSAST